MLNCSNSEQKSTTSFYYWKSQFQLNTIESSALNRSDSTLYLRYFDVAWDNKNNKAIPLAPIIFKTSLPDFIKIVPVVFIKNTVFESVSQDSLVLLSQKVLHLIQQINAACRKTPESLQIDCDWTERTKTNYFSFLNTLQQQSSLKLECTIRLHQIKYSTITGIPPVKKGVLMYYNMSPITAGKTNSIYDRATALKYIRKLKDYPLPLSYALPLFSWAVIHDGKTAKGLLNHTTMAMLSNDTCLTKQDVSNFQIRKSYFRNGHYLKSGEFLKLESVTPQQLEEMRSDLELYGKNGNKKFIYFELDSLYLN